MNEFNRIFLIRYLRIDRWMTLRLPYGTKPWFDTHGLVAPHDISDLEHLSSVLVHLLSLNCAVLLDLRDSGLVLTVLQDNLFLM